MVITHSKTDTTKTSRIHLKPSFPKLNPGRATRIHDSENNQIPFQTKAILRADSKDPQISQNASSHLQIPSAFEE
jgi:hypothetical protein